MKTVKLEPLEWYGICPNCDEGFIVEHDAFYEDGEMKDYDCSACGEVFHLTLPV